MKPTPAPKPGLHPRNRHRAGYDFAALLRGTPELRAFVRTSPAGTPTIDFADAAAVLALNRALLREAYGLDYWGIPAGYLCPPVPGRADYVHHLADLLASDGEAPTPDEISILDIGVGANAIYPIVGVHDYGWRFVGTDIDPAAVASAREIVSRTPRLAQRVDIRLQPDRSAVFAGVVKRGERFTAAMCNPPFHASAAEAAAGTQRKLRNLHGLNAPGTPLNFGGKGHELWCPGGEAAFIRRVIAESAGRPRLCRWFTVLVAKRETLPTVYRTLDQARAHPVKTIALAHGQKRSRIVAWRFPSR